ncbi:MAG: hypothetical protein OHK0050_25880 [Roseiflexaceae bacterium]
MQTKHHLFAAFVLVAMCATLLPPTMVHAAPLPPGRILFSAIRTLDGNSEIYSADITDELAFNLTNDPAPDIAPSFSPDGRQIAFASRREQNWDLYLIPAVGGTPQRLTDHPAYDSDPVFSPDGRQIAFTSNREGDLDIYLLDLSTGGTQRLTDDPAADYGPAFSPDGRTLAFTSWRDGQQEIYLLDLVSDLSDQSDLLGETPAPQLRNISQNDAPDYDPAFSPNGREIVYVTDRERVGTLVVQNLFTNQLTLAGPAGRTLSEPSWTPNGGLIAAGAWTINQGRFTSRQGVMITRTGVEAATYLIGGPHTYADPSWHPQAPAPTVSADRSSPGRLLTTPPIEQPAERQRGLIALEGVRAGGRAALAADVYPSFVALREAVIAASGRDFLGRLSEATRSVDFWSGTSSYTSWHKSGRAIDTLFSYADDGRQVLYIVPEPIAGRLFWRLYLYAQRQDGSQGAPLVAPIFNPSSKTLSPPPRGYFVDFTAIAAEHGWRRIAAQERDNFNWRDQLLALEYWHFERRDGLNWYQAMALVHDDTTLERLFNVDSLLEAGTRPQAIPNLGLPWVPRLPQISGPILLNRRVPS